MLERLDWERDGGDWPNREASRRVRAHGLDWHVQVAGSGPVALLLHGTGASTHSWRTLLPLLARRFTAVAPDLPGHAFTDTPASADLSLPGMARAVSGLIETLALAPALAVGHSAGAAVLARMCLDGGIVPRLLISLNGALLPLHGIAGHVFSPLARLLVRLPQVPSLLAWRARDRAAVERVLRDTGSRLQAIDVDLYARLFRSPAHVGATLTMMARWELEPLVSDLPRLATPLVLVACSEDRAIKPDSAFAVRDLVAGSRVEYLRGLGHLAHEERPEEIAALIERLAAETGIGV